MHALSTLVKHLHHERRSYVFLLPSVVLMGCFVIYPIVNVFYLAFTDATLVGSPELMGFANFRKLLRSPLFREVLGNTFVFMFSSVAAKMLFGLVAALLLNRPSWGRKCVRLFFLVPWATPRVVGAFSWQWIFNGLYGMLNDILFRLGIIDSYVTWLAHPIGAMVAVIVANFWLDLPFATIVYLAGLQAIPSDIYEAALVDGATKRQQLFHVTIPLIKPVILVLLVMMSIWTFNSFDVIWTLTQGGPLRSTEVLVTWTYKAAFDSLDFGYASAVAIFTFVILIVLSVLYFRLMSGRADYAN